MTAYIRRPHDKLLRAMLDPDVPGSRLIVVRGEPATGKTRAVYEAIVDRLADWSLEYPLTAAALAARLEAGIPARTVLWLGELRHYADADGGATALSRLGGLLEGEGRLVVTTIWPEHWDLYAAAVRGGTGAGDPAGVAGRLLDTLEDLAPYGDGVEVAYGGILEVPARFTTEEMTTAAAAGDPVLAAAAAYGAGHDGQVTQYLAGVPELLRRYDGPGGDPGGQAIITAAMDAARLGHAGPLPAALIQDAAAGYLAGPLRTGDDSGAAALAWAAAEFSGAVRALQPSPADGGYRVAGYLEWHGRHARADRLGPASLWDALVARVSGAGDLARLAQAAWDRGLYRYAAALGGAAARLGSTDAARQLVTSLYEVSPADAARAGLWAVGKVGLDDPWEVAGLLEALRAAGAGDAIRALLARQPGARVRLAWWDLGRLLAALREVALHEVTLHAAGAQDAIGALAGRAAVQVSLDNPRYVAWLLRAMHAAGAVDAVGALAARAAADVSLDDMSDVAALLGTLHAVRAGDAVGVLAGRAAGEVSIDNPQEVAWLLRALQAAGAQDAVAAVLARDPAAHADADQAWESAELVAALHAAGDGDAVRVFAARAAEQAEGYPDSTARLLAELRAAGADDAVRALLARDLAGQADLHFAEDLGVLLAALREAGAGDAVQALGLRAAEQAVPYDPSGVAPLLTALHGAGAAEAVRVLAARTVDDIGLGAWDDVADLLEALCAAGADGAARALATRVAGEAGLGDLWDVASLLAATSAAGAVEAVGVLAARAAGQASFDDAQGAARLLEELRAVGTGDAARAVATRAAGEASLDDAQGVARLLEELRAAGAGEAAAALLARDPAGQVTVGSDPPFRSTRRRHVVRLLQALRAAGADDAVRVLARRAADAGLFGVFLEAYPGEAPGYRFGREPDGAPSPSWTWQPPAGAG